MLYNFRDAKNYTSIAIYEKNCFFSLYTYIPIHEKKLFSLYTHALKNSFSLYRHGLYKISIPFQRFLFPFSIYTRCLYKNFLYIHSLLIYKNFFSHCLYAKISFLFFLYRYDILFTTPLLSLFLALLWC